MAKTISKTQPMTKSPVEDHDDDHDEDEDEDEHDEHDDAEEGDDHDDEDEEDDDEDEEENVAASRSVIAHSTRTVAGRVPQAPVVAPHEAPKEDSTWWAPHAVLGALIFVGILGFFGVFTKGLGPVFFPKKADSSQPAESASAPKPAAPPASTPQQQPAQQPKPIQPVPTARPTAPIMQQPPPVETFSAKHIVVQYKGAVSANPKITRSKDDAKKRANDCLAKLKKGAKWEDMVKEYSDEEGAEKRGGNLGRFAATAFDKTFIEAVKKLKPNEMSDVVESPLGFHIIVRTE